MITSSKVSKLLVIIFWFATQTPWAIAANENSATFSCPPSITVEQKSIVPIDGWEVANGAASHKLASVTFFEGHPNEKVSLVNDKEKRTKKVITQTWKFHKASSNYWVRCSYARASVSLSKAIPKDATGCVVTLDRVARVGGLHKFNGMRCQ